MPPPPSLAGLSGTRTLEARTCLFEAFQPQLYMSQKIVPLPPVTVIFKTSLALPLLLFMLFLSLVSWLLFSKEGEETD